MDMREKTNQCKNGGRLVDFSVKEAPEIINEIKMKRVHSRIVLASQVRLITVIIVTADVCVCTEKQNSTYCSDNN